MSADNWRVCPKCKAKEAVARKSAYGTVSEEEYLRILSEQKERQQEDALTLREDYELRTDEDGLFYVSYRCRCDRCGFRFEYKFEKELTKKVA